MPPVTTSQSFVSIKFVCEKVLKQGWARDISFIQPFSSTCPSFDLLLTSICTVRYYHFHTFLFSHIHSRKISLFFLPPDQWNFPELFILFSNSVMDINFNVSAVLPFSPFRIHFSSRCIAWVIRFLCISPYFILLYLP